MPKLGSKVGRIKLQGHPIVVSAILQRMVIMPLLSEQKSISSITFAPQDLQPPHICDLDVFVVVCIKQKG